MHGVLAAQQSGRAATWMSRSRKRSPRRTTPSSIAFAGSEWRCAPRLFRHALQLRGALLPCADGWVAISPREEHQWTRWLEVMGRPAWADEPRFRDRGSRAQLVRAVPAARGVERAAPRPSVPGCPGAPGGVFSARHGHRPAGIRATRGARFLRRVDDPLVRAVLPGRPYHLSTERRASIHPAVGTYTVDHHRDPSKVCASSTSAG